MELEHTQDSYQITQVKESVKQGGKPQDLEDEVKTQAGTMQTLSMDNVGGPSGDFHHSFDKVPSMHDQGNHDDFGDSNEHRSSIEELGSHGNTEPSLEKLKGDVNKATTEVKEQAQKFVDIASQKVSEFKDKLGSHSTGFKAEVNPAKDLDQDVKDQIELVNEEIHHQPHPDEQIIESQGQSLSQKSGGDQSKGLGGKVASKAEGLKQSSQKMVDQALSQGQNLKGQAQQLLGQAAGKASEMKTKLTSKLPGQEVNPMKDLTEDMKEQHEKVNEEIQHVPHPDEEVFESQGQSDIQGGSQPAKTEAIKAQAQEWTDKAVQQAGSLRAQGTQGLESFKDSARGALKKASQKIEETKSKVSSQISGLGQEVNPSKDLSPDMKEQLEKVNEEIHHQPHPDEEIVESQGKKQESSKGKNFQDMSRKLEQGKETLKSQTQEVKKQAQQWTVKAAQKAEEFKGKASAKEGEISKEIADKIEDLAHMLEAQQHPHHELSKESASFKPSQSSRGGNQKLQISQDFLKPEHPEHHLTVSSPSFRPNKKSHSAMEEFEELEAQKLSQQQGHLEVPEQHEHHQLSTESPSFQSGLESKVLVEAVREALIDDSVPLIAKVEEAEEHLKEEQSHRKPDEDESEEKFWQEEWKVLQDRKEGKQRDSPTNIETQQERVPLLDAVTQGVQGVSDSITHKIQNVKEGILGTKNPEATEEQSGSSENQDRVPLIDVVAQNISDSIHHKIENVKDVLRYRKVEESEEKDKLPEVKEETIKESRLSEPPVEPVPQSSPQTEEERVPLVDLLSQGAQNLSENITKKVQDVKQNVLGGNESYVSQDEGRVPLLDVVTQKVENVKGTLHLKKTEEEGKMSQEKSEMNENLIKIESPSDAQIDQERVPMIDTVNQGLQNISNSIAQKVQKVKDTLHHKKTEEGEEGEGQTSNTKEEGSKSKFGLFAKLTNKITGIKNKFMSSKEQPEDEIESLDDKENMRS